MDHEPYISPFCTFSAGLVDERVPWKQHESVQFPAWKLATGLKTPECASQIGKQEVEPLQPELERKPCGGPTGRADDIRGRGERARAQCVQPSLAE